MSTTSVNCRINAPRAAIYRALIDPLAIPHWKVPDGMTCEVHAFEAREGGKFRISLTYDLPTNTGKTTARTDTYHGHFAKLVPDEQVVEIDVFETEDPAMQGEMMVTYTLTEEDDGSTLFMAVHEGVPDGIAPADNELGWQMSLGKLAAFVEGR
ncbi:SRPBCC family protein [Verrucomicrobium sp. BvORR034]|uniref:SRPBCC family protein n=1 Tax=Verrucomicrobium sp. BvORR034 TaxID=1396418 RepID=UPI000679DBA3|nr:SRPBCC family protein [Verrucomicrobium sp. BvORR034]